MGHILTFPLSHLPQHMWVLCVYRPAQLALCGDTEEILWHATTHYGAEHLQRQMLAIAEARARTNATLRTLRMVDTLWSYPRIVIRRRHAVAA